MEVLPVELRDPALLRRLVFAVVYLPRDLPHYWSLISQFVGDRTKDLSPESLRVAVENLEVLNSAAFVSDQELVKKIHAFSPPDPSSFALGIILISSHKQCGRCGGKLYVKGDRPSRVTVYTETLGTLIGTHYHKICQNFRKGCSFRQFYGYSSEGSQSVTFYDSDWESNDYFISSSETAFELRLLRHFDVELLLGQLSYSQKSEIYNYSMKYPVQPKKCTTLDKEELPKRYTEASEQLCSRMRLDRRRLELAHLKYALLMTQKRYARVATTLPTRIPMHTDLAETLEVYTPLYYKAFTQKYSEHRCKFPGCSNVLVLDGNMKNRRDICYAKDAGFVQYPGLPGQINTGCVASPAFKSRFCQQHSTRSCSSKAGESSTESGVVELLLADKETRGSKYYQVLWLGRPDLHITLEPGSSLPTEAIQEYEEGLVSASVQQSSTDYGRETCTFVVTKNTGESQRVKKSRIERPLVQDNESALSKDKTIVSCNTEKDKHIRLNQRTAAILAGMRPCGIILMLHELFTAESKSQVYGYLHNYFRLHPSTAKTIDFICYDDACHLRKYARNPTRMEQTEQGKQLASVEMVVDKMHFKGHTDPWCLSNCNPANFEPLKKVDTEVCEQVFSWLSRYSRMTQKMSQHVFMFFLLYLCDLHNTHEEQKLQHAGFS